jgi:hypothetical protein
MQCRRLHIVARCEEVLTNSWRSLTWWSKPGRDTHCTCVCMKAPPLCMALKPCQSACCTRAFPGMALPADGGCRKRDDLRTAATRTVCPRPKRDRQPIDSICQTPVKHALATSHLTVSPALPRHPCYPRVTPAAAHSGCSHHACNHNSMQQGGRHRCQTRPFIKHQRAGGWRLPCAPRVDCV